MMTTMAIDQDVAHAHLSHLAEGDLDRPAVGVCGRMAAGRAGHVAIETRRKPESNCRLVVAQNARGLLPVGDVENRRAHYHHHDIDQLARMERHRVAATNLAPRIMGTVSH
ncbi:hypothetical protein [Bradyrhizobium sp. MOS001]|uniref:hypothetical protein n=1 Tax=unclassified Bradyrhizobium TaxID=2631580 RepID=UPI001431FC0F|nr:hypothetical protein [Bradyrhizobium sp. MOS001]